MLVEELPWKLRYGQCFQHTGDLSSAQQSTSDNIFFFFPIWRNHLDGHFQHSHKQLMFLCAKTLAQQLQAIQGRLPINCLLLSFLMLHNSEEVGNQFKQQFHLKGQNEAGKVSGLNIQVQILQSKQAHCRGFPIVNSGIQTQYFFI